jgi:hypothetical protein
LKKKIGTQLFNTTYNKNRNTSKHPVLPYSTIELNYDYDLTTEKNKTNVQVPVLVVLLNLQHLVLDRPAKSARDNLEPNLVYQTAGGGLNNSKCLNFSEDNSGPKFI